MKSAPPTPDFVSAYGRTWARFGEAQEREAVIQSFYLKGERGGGMAAG